MAARVSSPVLIDRAEELAALEAALACAEAGLAATALVGGDAGVGKTRLVTEFAARAGGRSATVLSGGCIPLATGMVPYAPVVELLNDIADQRVMEELPPHVVDRLARLVPGGSRAAQPEQPDEKDQSRLFYALLALFERLAADAPLVLVVEDLHWADRSTRDLVSFLTGAQRRCRMLLVLTYRADELPARHPLRRLIAELTRAGAFGVPLRPLGRQETAEQLAGILRGPVQDDLVERVFARSEATRS